MSDHSSDLRSRASIGSRFGRRAWAAVVSLVIAASTGCSATTSPGASPGTSAAASPTDSAAPISPLPTVSPTTTPTPVPRRTPVRVAIFGDSQGTSLFVTRPRTVDKYLKLSDESLSACGILRGRVVSRSGERFDLIGACPNWLSAWRADAKRTRPAIALVILGAWDVFDLKTPNAGTLIFGSAQWDAAFLAALRSGLAAIRESGAQIALAELPCYRPRKTNPRPPGWWPERGEDDRVQHVNDLLRQATDGVHIFTVRPAAAFCTDRAVGDNRQNRYDGVHYLQPGAKVYFDAIIPQLLTLPS